MIYEALVSNRAQKHLRTVPQHVADKLYAWVKAVRRDGLEMVRRIPGFHDEPLRGARRGQRSIRLSRNYRAIYIVVDRGVVEVAFVEEVTKHEY